MTVSGLRPTRPVSRRLGWLAVGLWLAAWSRGGAADAPDGVERGRLRDFGLSVGQMPVGRWNAITDVPGVAVGHCTLIEGDGVRTGVTVVLPHPGNVMRHKVPAAVHVANGFGKLAGVTQIEELGNLETPIVLTNTLAVAAGLEGLVAHTLAQPGNETVRSVNAVVGETNDGRLNDIRRRVVGPAHVRAALATAASGPVAEGNVGAGTGTVCFGWKGGIGTASRVLPPSAGGYTVGVLVQTNFGGGLQIAGVPVGVRLGRDEPESTSPGGRQGSCMIVVATDAPLLARNLGRLARRAVLGLARTGSVCANGSGDYTIAFSSAESVRVAHESDDRLERYTEVRNDHLTPLFQAVVEATEEAVLNSLFQARTMTGHEGRRVEALPLRRVVPMLGGRLPE